MSGKIKAYSVGIYVHSNEPISVENQKITLAEYAAFNGWDVFKIYADDGFSGGRYGNRPAFREMMADAENGLINLILTRDLSRLGRDYAETGRYLAEVFPSLGIRFVALADNIDSADDINIQFFPLRALMNDSCFVRQWLYER